MLKKGFTLAEVMIALALIGVIASMTIPTFISNSKTQSNASKLATTVNAVENALTTMIAAEGINDLTESKFYNNGTNLGFNQIEFAKYFNASIFNSSNLSCVQNYYGSGIKFRLIDSSNSTIAAMYHDLLVTKNGTVLVFYRNLMDKSSIETTLKQNGISETVTIGDLYIDVNGKAKPNVSGRDYFVFKIGANGNLYPIGSSTYSYLTYGNNNRHWEKGSDTTFKCTDSQRMGGCTARLIENNYIVDY